MPYRVRTSDLQNRERMVSGFVATCGGGPGKQIQVSWVGSWHRKRTVEKSQ